MGKIYYIMGKSATGKDTVYKGIRDLCPNLRPIVPYTTRPIRAGEQNGVEYYFSSLEEMNRIREAGKLIEVRTYPTTMGPWHYFTVDDGQFNPEEDTDFLMIGTLESYEKMTAYYGRRAIVPIYLEIPDGVRLLRSLAREKRQENPNYREVCRRFLADETDFSEENLKRMKIEKRYLNLELADCLRAIRMEITGAGNTERGKR